MDLRQLRFMVAVAETGAVRAAARRLGMAQPPISQALLALESELGVELMRRTPRGIELTPEGDELARRARQILLDVDSAREAVRNTAGQSRTLRIGMLAGLCAAGELTVPIIQGFRDAHPEIDVTLHVLGFHQTRALLDDEIDVALIRHPIDETGLNVVSLTREPLTLLVSAQGPYAGASELSIDDIAQEPTVPLDAPREWAAFWQLDEVRGRANPHPSLPPAEDVAGVQWAVATQSAVLAVTESLVRTSPNPLIDAVRVRDTPLSTCAVACRRDDRRTAVQTFIEETVATTRRHLARNPQSETVAAG